MRRTTSVCLPTDQLEYVRHLAEVEDRSVSTVLRHLVEARKEQDEDAHTQDGGRHEHSHA